MRNIHNIFKSHNSISLVFRFSDRFVKIILLEGPYLAYNNLHDTKHILEAL